MSQITLSSRLVYEDADDLTVFPSRSFDTRFLRSTKPFSRWIKEQTWNGFLGLHRETIPHLVREFYRNLRKETAYEDYISSRVCGKEIVITPIVLSEILHAPLVGTQLRRAGDIRLVADYPQNYLLPDGDTRGVLSASELPRRARQLLYMIEEYIYPKKYFTNKVTALDRCIMWHVMEYRPLNLPVLLMRFLSIPHAFLGLGSLITSIILCQGVHYLESFPCEQGLIINGEVVNGLSHRDPLFSPPRRRRSRREPIDASEPAAKKRKVMLPVESGLSILHPTGLDSAESSEVSYEDSSFYDAE